MVLARRSLPLVLLVLLVAAPSAGATARDQTSLVSAIDARTTPPDDPGEGLLPFTPDTISADGSKVLVSSFFDQGLSGVVPREQHLYVRSGGSAVLADRQNGTNGAASNGTLGGAGMSAEGRYVGFVTNATNLGGCCGGPNTYHLYVRDLQTNTTRQVDAGVSGGVSSEFSLAVGADGHLLVAFVTTESLVAGDTNTTFDLYLRDMSEPTVAFELVSAATGTTGTAGNQYSVSPAFAAGGEYVAFTSRASNLVGAGNDNDSVINIFRRRVRSCLDGSCAPTTETLKIDVTEGGVHADGDGSYPTISADGSRIAFRTHATNLRPDVDDGGDQDVVRWTAGATPRHEVLSVQPGNPTYSLAGDAGYPRISHDGSATVFESSDSSLVPPALASTHYYVADASGLELVDRATGPAGAIAAPASSSLVGYAGIDADGSHVAFTSYADNLSTEEDEDHPQVFVRDRNADTTTLITTVPGGPTGFGGGGVVQTAITQNAVSADGRYAVFYTVGDLIPGTSSREGQIFLRDTVTNRTRLVSRADGPNGAPADEGGYWASVSDDGRYVAFSSTSTNLPGPSTDDVAEVFVRDTVDDRTIPVSRPDGVAATNANFPAISGDGRHVAWAQDLDSDPADQAGGGDGVYVRDLDSGVRTFVSRKGAESSDLRIPEEHHPALAISDDGSRVAFLTAFSDDSLVSAHVRDVTAGTTTLVSRLTGAAGDRLDGQVEALGISGDGTVVAMSTTAQNIGADPDESYRTDVVIRDLAKETTTLIPGTDGDTWAWSPSVTDDGGKVGFTSNARLTPGDTDTNADNYLFDRATGAFTLVSRASGASGAPMGSVDPRRMRPQTAMSDDGGCVVFVSSGDHGALPADVPSDLRVFLRAVSRDCPAEPGGPGVDPTPAPTPTPTPVATAVPTPVPTATPQPPLDRVGPKLSGVSLTNTTFRVGAKPTAVRAQARGRRSKAGTIVRFSLSETATTTLVVQRESAGRRSGKACVKPTKKLRTRKACKRYTTSGTLTRASRRGTNLVAFSGRIGKKALPAGRYRLVISATDAAGNRSATLTKGFRIVKR